MDAVLKKLKVIVKSPCFQNVRIVDKDFPGGPVVKTSPCSAEGMGSSPDQRTKIPHAPGCGKKNKLSIKTGSSPVVSGVVHPRAHVLWLKGALLGNFFSRSLVSSEGS